MFSYIIGKIFLHVDIRDYQNDRNPGASSLYKAGGKIFGTIGLALDFAKGFVPIFLAKNLFSFSQSQLVLISIAPILGHSFSPFLKFRGGKALDTTFGVWSGLTLWEAPIIIGASYTIMILLFKKIPNSIISILGFIILLIYFLVTSRYENYMLYIWCINFIILVYNLKVIREIFSKRRDLAT
jgi:glycerol-3-phosphate acyltransferase PlsY